MTAVVPRSASHSRRALASYPLSATSSAVGASEPMHCVATATSGIFPGVTMSVQGLPCSSHKAWILLWRPIWVRPIPLARSPLLHRRLSDEPSPRLHQGISDRARPPVRPRHGKCSPKPLGQPSVQSGYRASSLDHKLVDSHSIARLTSAHEQCLRVRVDHLHGVCLDAPSATRVRSAPTDRQKTKTNQT